MLNLLEVKESNLTMNQNNKFLVIYTSFSEPKSQLNIINERGVIKKIQLQDGALENALNKNGSIYIPSRYSGNYFILNNKGIIRKESTVSKKGITNIFDSPLGINLITNGGQLIKNKKIFYKSGIYTSSSRKELNFVNGFLLQVHF